MVGRRAFVVVLDACGAGELPDSAAYGDAGANTLAHLAEAVGGLRLPNLQRIGLGSILPLKGVAPAIRPALHGRLHPLGPGKDSTAGHWELMGVIAPSRPPVYPEGFPEEVIALITEVSGRGVICNRPCNGIEAIETFGAEHERTARLIVYTSQDSVLQIAAHTAVVSPGELHSICRTLRERLPAGHAVGRVIARPFTGDPGGYRRTEGRRDFSVEPPGRSYLEEVQDSGIPVHAVGKAGALFCGIGVDVQHAGPTNAKALLATDELIEALDAGLVFTNLIETDQVYGHRHDADGFHLALQEIDGYVGHWLTRLRAEDVLILTADHGCDVAAEHTDHTREHAPLLAAGPRVPEGRHDGPLSDVGASVLQWLCGRRADLSGEPFLPPPDAAARRPGRDRRGGGA